MRLLQEVVSAVDVSDYNNLMEQVLEFYTPIIISENKELLKNSDLILESNNLTDIHNNIKNFIIDDFSIFLETVSEIISNDVLTIEDKIDILFEEEPVPVLPEGVVPRKAKIMAPGTVFRKAQRAIDPNYKLSSDQIRTFADDARNRILNNAKIKQRPGFFNQLRDQIITTGLNKNNLRTRNDSYKVPIMTDFKNAPNKLKVISSGIAGVGSNLANRFMRNTVGRVANYYNQRQAMNSMQSQLQKDAVKNNTDWRTELIKQYNPNAINSNIHNVRAQSQLVNSPTGFIPRLNSGYNDNQKQVLAQKLLARR